jgi:hypothetical protein
MTQFAREVLSLQPRGWTRADLKEIMRSQPAFWHHLESNPGSFHWMVRDLIKRGEIEERDGLLFATERTRLAVVVRRELFEVNPDAMAAPKPAVD